MANLLRVTAVDWLIVAFTVLLAFYGYLQGFIVGALSLVGFALGAFLGTRVGPLLLPAGSHSQYAPLFGLVGALLAGGVLASGLEGLGLHARSALRLPGLRTIDGLLGAALTACVGLGIAWIIGAVALESSGSQPLRADIQRSAILRELDQLLPPSGPILNALARFDPLPSVRGPAADVRRPPAEFSPPTRLWRRSAASCASSARRVGWGSRGADGSPHPGSWSRTRTSSPARPTRLSSRTGSRLAYGRKRWSSIPTTTSRCCGCPVCRRPR